MNLSKKQLIYTIGHSTRDIDEFVEMLQSFEIKTLVDIRRFPGSRKYPHFNQETIKKTLTDSGINYIHLEGLGGRRKEIDKSGKSRWRNSSFRSYAAYMETHEFRTAAKELMDISSRTRTVYMCSEAVWWRCHRALVSDYLKVNGWTVYHILTKDKIEEHPYTSPAKVVDGKLSYSE
jgi:uncharacterized protein (DUF488 family)